MGKDDFKNGSWKPAIFTRKNETFALKYNFEINFKVSKKRPHQDNNIN